MSKQSFTVDKSLRLRPIDPSTLTNPKNGELVCDSTDSNKLKKYNESNSTWEAVSSGSGVATSAVDNAFTVNDSTDATKQIAFDASGTTGTKTTFQAAQTANRTITFPDATDTVVTLAASQALTNKTIVAASNTITTAASGNLTSTELNSALSELQQDIDNVRNGVDVLNTDTADIAAIGDYTQTGLEILSTPVVLHGTKSFRLQHSTSIKSFKKVIAVDRKFRGKNLTALLDVVSSATSGNLNVLFYDETNATNLVASQAIATNSQALTATTANASTSLTGMTTSAFNTLKVGMIITGSAIPVGTTITALNTSTLTATLSQAATGVSTGIRISDLVNRKSFSFGVPTNCLSMSYTISSVVEANTESYIDDIVVQLTQQALSSTSITIPVNNDYDWVDSGLTTASAFVGFGTPTAVSIQKKRAGDSLFLRGYFTSGTQTSVEYRIPLPDSLAIKTGYVAGSPLGQYSFNAVLGSGQNFYLGASAASNGYLNLYTHSQAAGYSIANTTGPMPASGSTYFIESGPIPVAGWSSNQTTSTTIPLTTAQLVQTPDSVLKLNTATGYGSTATKVLRFTNIEQNLGSAIQYISDAVNGDRIVAQKEGTYNISFSWSASTASDFGITRNQTAALTSNITVVSENEVLVKSETAATNISDTASVSAYLYIGDTLRVVTDGSTVGARIAKLSITQEGSLKQLNPSSDSKITIPTHQLRFEGASARGSTDTFIVKFDTQAITQGDAWTIVGTPSVNGTVVQMNKAGKLSVQANLLGVAGMFTYISKNQSVLTTTPTTSELQCRGSVSSLNYPSIMSCTFDVNIGDKIRIGADVTPTANALNILSLSLTETSIPANFSNVLPQWSQSDSCIVLNTGNGYGSTNTAIRRFTNNPTTMGSDISYTDDAALGASLKILTSGKYEISFTDMCGGINEIVGISRNTTQPTVGVDVLTNLTEVLAMSSVTAAGAPMTVTWSGELTAGDVIRPHNDKSTSANNGKTQFTISKVGKPNLTSVDVTPFVNINTQDTDVIFARNKIIGKASTFTSAVKYSAMDINTNKGVFTWIQDAVYGDQFKALKDCVVNISWSGAYGAGVIVNWITLNQANSAQTSSETLRYTEASTSTVNGSASFTGKLNVGDIVRFNTGGTFYGLESLSITATASSSSVIVPTQQVSSDTLSFAFKATAIASTDPIGTFNTYTYAASTNTATISGTAPTQTTSSMNTNGIQVFARAYNAASTTASPARVDIFIGTGLKSKQVDAYTSLGKVGAFGIDLIADGTASWYGTYTYYNETTGILTLNAGISGGSVTTRALGITDGGSIPTTGYFVFNASKAPSIAALPILSPRIATLSDQKASGTASGTFTSGSFQTRTLNTIVDTTGVVTSLSSNQFVLSAGEYYIEAMAPAYGVNTHQAKLRNITDSTDVIIGTGEAVGSGNVIPVTHSKVTGSLVITSAKTFELQHRCGTTYANGFGAAMSFGVNEVYSICKITKIK